MATFTPDQGAAQTPQGAATPAPAASSPGVVQPGQVPANVPGNSKYAWAQSFLTQGGFPLCPNNLIALVGWQQREGGGGAYNPLNTTLPESGSTPLAGNSAGVQNYSGWGAGLQANVDTLLHTGNGSTYANVRAALQQCADPAVTAAAIQASPWDGGHYGGDGSLAALFKQLASDATAWTTAASSVAGSAALIPGTGTPQGADAGAAVPDSLPGLGSLLGWLGLPSWKRVGMGAAGLLLIVGGVALFVTTTKPGQEAIAVAPQALLAAA